MEHHPGSAFTLTLPEWAVEELKQLPTHMPTLEERMAHVIRFSRLNFERGTGGPFAAGVFERDSGKLVVIGVNRVVPSNCSSAHAEIMALSLAQNILGTFDLGGAGMPAHQLVVNWRTCAMCYGAVCWSGIRSLVLAGDGPELEEITGFDEGPIHPEWDKELAKRGIELIRDVKRDDAIQVFRDFAASGSLVYNGRQG
ncbi:MAG TPA: nucleoside deaminase [Oceanobacillus sp.]|nr:nucleoside deaminase [Oceanobacillus sp.]